MTTADARPDGQMTILEHLAELRTRIIVSILAIVVAGFVVFFLWNPVLDVLQRPYCSALDLQVGDQGCRLNVFDPLEGFRTRIRVSLYGGIGLAMPVLLWELWRFVTPALHDHEKRWAVPFIVSSLLLFALGVGVAYWALDRAIDFLIDVSGDDIETFFRPSSYIGFVTFMLLAFGVGFQFPILLLFLQLANVVLPRQLARSRRYSIVGIVILAAVITPSGDPLTLASLSVPLYLFYEISIVLGHLLTRHRRTKEENRRWWLGGPPATA